MLVVIEPTEFRVNLAQEAVQRMFARMTERCVADVMR